MLEKNQFDLSMLTTSFAGASGTWSRTGITETLEIPITLNWEIPYGRRGPMQLSLTGNIVARADVPAPVPAPGAMVLAAVGLVTSYTLRRRLT